MRLIHQFALILTLAFSVDAIAENYVGWIGPLTGPAAILGIDALSSLRLALQQSGRNTAGIGLEVLAQDDQYQVSKALDAYEYLVHQRGVKVLVMLTYGAIFAVAERAKADGVLVLDPLDCDNALAALPNSVLCFSKSTEQMGRILGATARDRSELPAGVLAYANDPFMGTLAQEAAAVMRQNSAHAVEIALYDAGTSDFRQILQRFKAHGVRSILFLGYDEMGLAMRQARQLGLRSQFYTINTVQSPAYRAAAGASSDDALVSTFMAPRTDEFKRWHDAMVQRNGQPPSFEVSAVPSFDLGILLTKSLGENGSFEAAEVRKLLLNLKGYAGLSGSITMDPDGAVRSIVSRIFKLRGTKLLPGETEGETK